MLGGLQGGRKIRFKVFYGKKDFGHVELVEFDKSFDFSCRKGTIIFTTLLNAQGPQQLFDYIC